MNLLVLKDLLKTTNINSMLAFVFILLLRYWKKALCMIVSWTVNKTL